MERHAQLVWQSQPVRARQMRLIYMYILYTRELRIEYDSWCFIAAAAAAGYPGSSDTTQTNRCSLLQAQWSKRRVGGHVTLLAQLRSGHNIMYTCWTNQSTQPAQDA